MTNAESIRNHAAVIAMADPDEIEALTHEQKIDLEVTVRQAANAVRDNRDECNDDPCYGHEPGTPGALPDNPEEEAS